VIMTYKGILVLSLMLSFQVGFAQGKLMGGYGKAFFGSGDLIGDVVGVGYQLFFTDGLGVEATVQSAWAKRVERDLYHQSSSTSICGSFIYRPINGKDHLELVLGGLFRNYMGIYGSGYVEEIPEFDPYAPAPIIERGFELGLMAGMNVNLFSIGEYRFGIRPLLQIGLESEERILSMSLVVLR